MNIFGADRPVYVIHPDDPLEAIVIDIVSTAEPISFDTEATGLDHFASDYHVRTVQFGHRDRAWVLQVEKYPRLARVVEDVLARALRLTAHNATYDVLALHHLLSCDMDALWAKTTDTILLSHLLDPRGRKEGGSGQGLEALAARYTGDPDAERFKRALFAHFKEQRWSTAEGYARVDIDEPVFIEYAAADVFLSSWLLEAIQPLVVARGFAGLSEFEHAIARICTHMEQRGIRVDTTYAAQYALELDAKAEAAAKAAETWGITKVNSTAQVSEALIAMGVELTAKTPTGNWKVDKEVLESIAEHGHSARVRELAANVMTAKNAGRFRSTYVDKVVASLDASGHVHPSIHTLQARTARMSVSNPPLQQIPSDDWKTRRMYIADEGMLIGASDYSQVELRMLGMLAGEKNIYDAVLSGIDLHTLTADRVGLSRKVAKMVNFLIVYGGGAKSLARKAGIPLEAAQAAVSGFKRAYPAVARYARRLIDQSEMGKLAVTTATGRELPLDRSRVFAAVNYVVQSSARDILGQALLELDDAGLTQYLLLPVHDELIFQAPAEDAQDVARAIGETMTMEVQGMPFEAEGEVYGNSWGDGYLEAA